jgi:hypothetical protein
VTLQPTAIPCLLQCRVQQLIGADAARPFFGFLLTKSAGRCTPVGIENKKIAVFNVFKKGDEK